MPQYHCTQCDHRFEHRGGKLRCPKCLRHHGLEEISDAGNKPRQVTNGAGKRIWLAVAVLLLVVGLVAGTWRLVEFLTGGSEAGQARQVMNQQQLTRALRQRDVPPEHVVHPFATTGALSKWVPAAARSGSDVVARARAVANAIAGKVAGLRVDLSSDRLTQVRTAAELAEAIAGGAADRALSYELAVLVTAALRAAGLAALLCEADTQRAPVKVADISGALGRYGVAVFSSPAAVGEPKLVLDPARAARLPDWAGGGLEPQMSSKLIAPRPIDDESAAARLLALRALVEVERSSDAPERAYELIHLALDASVRPSATLHGARALVLAAAGSAQDAVDEAHRAVAQRDDAAFRTLLAQLLLVQGKAVEAEQQLTAAVKKDPTFWPAHRALAALAWLAADNAAGDQHLKKAQELAPQAPSVQALLARRKFREGDAEGALSILTQLARDAPSHQVLLQLYVTLKTVGQTERAQAIRAQLLDMTKDRDKIEQVLQTIDQAHEAAATTSESH